MTKNRFKMNFQGEMLVSVKDTKRDCNVNILQIIKIANNLAKENEQLKNDLLELHEICTYYEGRIKELKEDSKND